MSHFTNVHRSWKKTSRKIPYLNSLKKLGVKNSEAIVIEDSPHGIESAKNAGIKVIAYKTKVFTNDDLREADFIIEDLNEIFSLLGENPT